jgi:ABC-2 type transport system ATP-binding protein
MTPSSQGTTDSGRWRADYGDPMLRVHGLTRVYGDTTVLDHVSFGVRPGRMTGFVGANGAGKTTTMRMIVGVLAPTAGRVTWDGEDITVEQRRRIGYMPEERGLYPKMRLRDQLVFFGRLHGQSTKQADARARDLLGRLGLAERVDDVLETLSLGNQQRVQIATALMHHPAALVMDEPFSGLDPVAVDSMVALLRDEVTPEIPVLFSSHQLELVERLCDDLVILSNGRLVAAGSVDELRGQEVSRFRVVLAEGRDAGQLRQLGEVTVLEVTGPEALVELGDLPPEKVLEAVQRVAPVAEFGRVVRPLAQIYREAIQ